MFIKLKHQRASQTTIARNGAPTLEFNISLGRGCPNRLQRRIRRDRLRIDANLDQRGQALPLKPQGNRGNGLEIRRDLLARRPITTGRAVHQNPVFIGERDRKPIELELTQIRDLLGVFFRVLRKSEMPLDPRIELLKLLSGEGYPERLTKIGITQNVSYYFEVWEMCCIMNY